MRNKTNLPKCSEVHVGLSEEPVRNFLAREATRCYDEGALPDVEVARKIFEEAKAHLEASEKLQAIQTLIKEHGWEHHDVSDEVVDYDGRGTNRRYMGFVGNDKERKKIFGN